MTLARRARYAARNENSVPLVRPHNGLGARSAQKDAGLTSRGALPGPGSPTRVFHVAVASDRDWPALVSRSATADRLGWKTSRGRAPWLVSLLAAALLVATSAI